MKLKNPMLVVTDIDRSVEFYKKVFGLHIIMDFGANKTLTGGLALQTAETYKEFIGTSDISFGGNNFELYFEEDDFDKFADKLKEYDIEYATRLWNILGGSESFASMIRISILSKSERI